MKRHELKALLRENLMKMILEQEDSGKQEAGVDTPDTAMSLR